MIGIKKLICVFMRKSIFPSKSDVPIAEMNSCALFPAATDKSLPSWMKYCLSISCIPSLLQNFSTVVSNNRRKSNTNVHFPKILRRSLRHQIHTRNICFKAASKCFLQGLFYLFKDPSPHNFPCQLPHGSRVPRRAVGLYDHPTNPIAVLVPLAPKCLITLYPPRARHAAYCWQEERRTHYSDHRHSCTEPTAAFRPNHQRPVSRSSARAHLSPDA